MNVENIYFFHNSEKVDQNFHYLTRDNLNTNKDNVLKYLKYELKTSYILVLECHTA